MRLRFDAPPDFDLDVLADYQAAFTLVDGDAEAWVVNPLGGYFSVPDAMPSLRVVATPSTGTNHLDLNGFEANGIKVLSLLDNRPALDTITASAEWTFKLLLDGLRLKRPYMELQGKTVGLIGYGRIGRKMSTRLQAFGAKWIAHDPAHKWANFPLERMFSECDAVVVCCTLNEKTRHMIGYDYLRLLKPNAILVNTARGEIIVESDLLRVMDERPFLRVCVDVVDGEVHGTAKERDLLMRGALVTPHIAGDTFESRTKAANIILGLLKRELEHGCLSKEAV